MLSTGIEAFEQTIQKSNEWLRDVRTELCSDDRQRAYRALRATLHALRDCLTPYEAVHLAAQLPTLIRGLYFEGWRIQGTPSRLRTTDEFLGAVAAGAGQPDLGTREVVGAVLRVLVRRLPPGEVEDVLVSLPAPIRELWPR